MQCTPFKPAIKKINGAWCVVIPQTVFGTIVTGCVHGPFSSWREAAGNAFGMAQALHSNLCVRNQLHFDIGMVN